MEDTLDVSFSFLISSLYYFVNLREAGVPFLPVSFEDLTERPRIAIESVLAFIGEGLEFLVPRHILREPVKYSFVNSHTGLS